MSLIFSNSGITIGALPSREECGLKKLKYVQNNTTKDIEPLKLLNPFLVL